MYDVKTAEAISGEVVSMDAIAPVKGMHYGVHPVVKTARETIAVHVISKLPKPAKHWNYGHT